MLDLQNQMRIPLCSTDPQYVNRYVDAYNKRFPQSWLEYAQQTTKNIGCGIGRTVSKVGNIVRKGIDIITHPKLNLGRSRTDTILDSVVMYDDIKELMKIGYTLKEAKSIVKENERKK